MWRKLKKITPSYLIKCFRQGSLSAVEGASSLWNPPRIAPAILVAKVTKDHTFLLNQMLSPRLPERSRRGRIPIKSSKNCPCNSWGESYKRSHLPIKSNAFATGSLSVVEGYASLKFPKIAGTDPSAKISNFKQFQSISRKFLLKIWNSIKIQKISWNFFKIIENLVDII